MLWLPLLAVARQGNSTDAEAFARKIWQSAADVQPTEYACKSTRLDIDGVSCYVVRRSVTGQKATLPGYMLVALAAEGSPVLLAYDDRSEFSHINLPAHIQSWLKGYETMLATEATTPHAIKDWMAASQSTSADVAPLLGAREWGQDNPYNLLCPQIDGQRCPSGCVATALAQIMSYHRWPQTGSGSISYQTSTHKLNIGFDFSQANFEWEKMHDTYMPMEDFSSTSDKVVIDSKYFLNSISMDSNSTPMSKCYVNVTGLTVMGTSRFEGEIVLLITDDNRNFVTRVTSSTSMVVRSTGKIIDSKSFLLYVPSTLADGTYRVYCAARSTDASGMSLANKRSGSSYIELVKEGNNFSLEGYSFPCSLSADDVTPVSTLMQAVGAAVEMDYALDGSASTDSKALTGLTTYLKYDSDMFFAYPSAYTDRQWHEILQQELAEGRPVYYTGQGIGSGHAFVIDGCQKSEDGTTYYHVNWGWDGLCNGYYLLNMLRPSSAGTGGSTGSNYANQPSMLIGMQPEDGISHCKMDCGGIDLLAGDYSAGSFIPIRIRTLSLQTNNSFSGQLNLYLENTEGSHAPVRLHSTAISLTAKRGMTNYQISAQIPANAESGTYRLWVGCSTSDGETADIRCSEWPSITVEGQDEWTGGPLTQPLKKLAVGGTLNTIVQAESGMVSLSIDSIANPMPSSTGGQLGIAICDNNGSMLTQPQTMTPISVNGYSVIRNVTVSTAISRHVPDGSYELRIGYLPTGATLWTYCDKITCEGNVWWAAFTPWSIPMHITNGRVSLPEQAEFEGAELPWTSGMDISTGHLPKKKSVYSLGGWKTTATSKGLYIMREDGKTVKLIKK